MNLEKFSKPVLRIMMSFVFLYFAFQQFTNVSDWAGFVPSYVLIFGISANNVVLFNAVIELVFGFLLLLGLFTRVVSLLLALHLFGIAFSIGFNPLGVRDFGLFIATLVVFFNGPDKYCLDLLWKKRT